VGGFLGIGHASYKTDRANFLSGIQDIKNVFNYALPTAQASIGAGQQSLGAASNYYQNLLSGNRAAMLQATAPEIAGVNARTDASRRQLATSGTARGGGVAATSQTAKDRAMAEIDNMLFGVRGGAARGAESVGRAQADIGTNLLGQAGGAAGTLSSESRMSREDSYKINQDMVGKWSQAILNVMAAFA
jgi:hypothetical protein